ncbi:hypothetical protein BASA50_002856 [Batrachochytrium salamandrivorans]|uniref:Chitin-binding type-1 domain-containing protein n=1 Tax=Batrachochytrium salamandrivorans TaxID=1357716 RepID=A0ABQ8FKK8_9FUNG|nr:hypothetical protein BASA50_002856 [Batrachochytrium salamandrivorans]
MVALGHLLMSAAASGLQLNNSARVSLPETQDGSCGKVAGFQCSVGDCCSQYSFCGSTVDYCGAGCQPEFGLCTNVPTHTSKIVATTTKTTITTSSDIPSSTSYPAPDPKKEPKLLLAAPSLVFSLSLLMMDQLQMSQIFSMSSRKTKSKSHSLLTIASHTLTHPDMKTLTADQMWHEMKDNDDLIRAIIGKSPTYMRPPYGNTNDLVLNAMGTWGYKVITWNLDSADWDHDGKPDMIALNEAAYQEDLKGHPLPYTSFISLQHDFVVDEVTWIQIVINKFKALKYKFVTVGECLGDRPANWYR